MTRFTSATLSILLALAAGSAYAYDATSTGTTASSETLAKWNIKQDTQQRGTSDGAYSPAQSG